MVFSKSDRKQEAMYQTHKRQPGIQRAGNFLSGPMPYGEIELHSGTEFRKRDEQDDKASRPRQSRDLTYSHRPHDGVYTPMALA